MWWVLGGLFLFLVSLIPGVQQKFEATVEGISGSITKGPVQTVTNAWIEVAFIAAGLGFAVWIAESHTAKKMGYEVAPPVVEPIRVATPPHFGAASGVTAGPGGVAVTSGVSAGTGGSAPAVPAPELGSRSRRPSRLERRAEREGLRAQSEEARAARERARTAASKARRERRQVGSGFNRRAA